MQEINVFWFRRDLRIEDNIGLSYALKSGLPILPVFIFDQHILDELPNNDPRVQFIHSTLQSLDLEFKKNQSSLKILVGDPQDCWEQLTSEFNIKNVFFNNDYEPYAINRDLNIKQLLDAKKINCLRFKDHVIFEPFEILKADRTPYTVYTPYKNKWLDTYKKTLIMPTVTCDLTNLVTIDCYFPILSEIGFTKNKITVLPYTISNLESYKEKRDIPSLDATSYLSVHLRFGTVSIRQIIRSIKTADDTFIKELIWREFFIQILYHFPKVIDHNFKSKYDGITWRNDKQEFEKWCDGKTGYPMVDAGMRQLNETGYMHNRVRMITAGFLCKHLLIDWKWGEAYFAQKLLDYELSSNNGNWQWAAGTGCDAAPYFRIFNPIEQRKKFDFSGKYVKKWIPEINELTYPQEIVEHKFARNRALDVYKSGISRTD